tara:strand:+ start:230 stop:403 length:174 start_codon:yes stop_codon:yes gene_type:complete
MDVATGIKPRHFRYIAKEMGRQSIWLACGSGTVSSGLEEMAAWLHAVIKDSDDDVEN